MFSIAFISILSAVLITMVAVGIQNPGTVVHATVETNLVTGFMSAANIAFSYGLLLFLLLQMYSRLTIPHSESQYFLHIHRRAQGPKRLPQSARSPPNRRHDPLHYRIGCDLPLRRLGRHIPGLGIRRPSGF